MKQHANSLKLQSVSTLFVEDIDHVDCAIWDGARIVGKSWHVDAYLSGPLDKNGFVYDFGSFKKCVKALLKSTVDHALLIPNDPAIKKNNTYNPTEIQMGNWHYKAPSGSIRLIDSRKIDEASVSKEIEDCLEDVLPINQTKIKITLREEASKDGTFFNYTHGITNHSGNCQRLFHGHRSLIRVLKEGQRNIDLESFLQNSFFKKNIHIVTPNQISQESREVVSVIYKGNQGLFEGSIPKEQVLILDDTNTSIEAITNHAAKFLESHIQEPNNIEVLCFEGIGKGSIKVIET